MPTATANSTSANNGRQNPTSFAFPNVIAFLFPVYWLAILAWRCLMVNVFRRRYPQATVILDNLIFAEGPRIRHRHHLYFSDMFGHAVVIFDLRTRRLLKTIPFGTSKVSGLGWLPPPSDKCLLVSLMDECEVVVHDENSGQTEHYADLSTLATFRINDMVVDSKGRTYIGNFGFDLSNLLSMRATTLSCIHPPCNQGDKTQVNLVQRHMLFPNGSVITPDGSTLIVAETLAGRLTAFDVDAADGTLSNRRVWAYVGLPLDGICLDSRGRVWAAVPSIGVMRARGGAVCITSGGRIDAVVGFAANGLNDGASACTLYTTEHGVHQLVLLTARTVQDEQVIRLGRRNAKVAVVQVDCGPALMADHPPYHAGYC